MKDFSLNIWDEANKFLNQKKGPPWKAPDVIETEDFIHAGKSRAEIRLAYQKIRALGWLRKSWYLVRLEPYRPKGPLSSAPLFQSGNESLFYLATDLSYPILQMDTDAVQIGGRAQSFATGFGAREVSMTIMETAEQHYLQTFDRIQECTQRKDGTWFAPADYLMIMRHIQIGKKGKTFDRPPQLVMLKGVESEQSASDSSPLTLQLSLAICSDYVPRR